MFTKSFSSECFQQGEQIIHYRHAGQGRPLLLLHGYPQTHQMWHLVAPRLAEKFHVICPDLRGYGDSSKPVGLPDHSNYSKRETANDLIALMSALGYENFYAAGHDRGARVLHRMALDYPQKVNKACVMDITPTQHMFHSADQMFSTVYYHWFFLIQPDGLPEKMIAADPRYYLTEKLKRWSASGAKFDEAVVDEDVRCFSDSAAIHASCEDYRAAASIDLEHDEASLASKVLCPLLVLWGSKGFVHQKYEVLAVWSEYALQVQGEALDCGHFLAEEQPEAVIDALVHFFGD